MPGGTHLPPQGYQGQPYGAYNNHGAHNNPAIAQGYPPGQIPQGQTGV